MNASTSMSASIPVYLELGKKRVCACALDWPGWCRLGKDEGSALDALASAAPRYASVAAEAGEPFAFDAGAGFTVAGRISGSGTTDFGVPAEIYVTDGEPLPPPAAARLAALVSATWRVFDRVVAAAPAELRKGPRGGGRDRDAVAQHVYNAEAVYARKLGISARTSPDPDRAAALALRDDILAALRGAAGVPPLPNGWPARYAARRIAWHVLDHAWEIEDRSSTTG